MMKLTLVGAFARVDPARAEAVRSCLAALPGVEVFDLEDPDRVGLLIEAADVDRAHQVLTGHIRGIEGVWGVWPAYVHGDTEETETEINF